METEIDEYGKQIEQRLVKAGSMDSVKYYQGIPRSLEWAVTGKDV